MKKVKWKEWIDIPEMYWNQIDENTPLYDEYKGEIIDTYNSFWRGTILVVACDDNKIREVHISKVEIIDNLGSIPNI